METKHLTMLWRGLCLVSFLFVACNSEITHQNQAIPQENDNDAVTDFMGKWDLFSPDAGVSAMHLILLPDTNNAVFFDSEIWNISRIKLPPGVPCRPMVGSNEPDCWSHSVIFDFESGRVKPQKINFDTWCSSGALDMNGKVVSTGGFMAGSDAVRYLDNCQDFCEWEEYPKTLGNGRWYGTQVILPDGQFLVFGGRGYKSYEYVPPKNQKNTHEQVIDFPFLQETNDTVENNLYPFVYVSPDGFLFVFANYRAILLDYKANKIVHEFPQLHPGARNYPASAASALLPVTLQPDEKRPTVPTIFMVCGGGDREAYANAEFPRPRVFLPALKDCSTIDMADRAAQWKRYDMPEPRILSDALNLPNGDVILLNGAKRGAAGWDCAIEPLFAPFLFVTEAPDNAKFKVLAPTNIARMYHSTAALLPDGKVMVAGSNTHDGYIYLPPFPTETRVEKFSPPYLDPMLDKFRLEIVVENTDKKLKYGQNFQVTVRGGDTMLNKNKLKVAIYYPPFTTHNISMNQRLLYLGIPLVTLDIGPQTAALTVQAPPNANFAQPGYYMMWVVYKGVPCKRAIWVQLLP